MIVFCVVRLLSKVTSVRFRQKQFMSVTLVNICACSVNVITFSSAKIYARK